MLSNNTQYPQPRYVLAGKRFNSVVIRKLPLRDGKIRYLAPTLQFQLE